jgi:hypothetical protein
MRGSSRAIFFGLLLLLVLPLTACGQAGSTTAPLNGSSAPVSMTLTDLHDVAELQATFSQDVGKPRLVLLVSPT